MSAHEESTIPTDAQTYAAAREYYERHNGAGRFDTLEEHVRTSLMFRMRCALITAFAIEQESLATPAKEPDEQTYAAARKYHEGHLACHSRLGCVLEEATAGHEKQL